MIKRHNFMMRLAMVFGGLELPNVKREDGQTLAEYALILSLIAVAVVGVVIALGGQIGNIFSDISSKI
ncbi:MAG TPA: Flp family type IVb pilin [Gaiellaceae bacterium]|jgi:Flp pilus assembly pilin Flp